MFTKGLSTLSSAGVKMPNALSKLPNSAGAASALQGVAGKAINKALPSQLQGMAKNAVASASQKAVNKGSNVVLNTAVKNVPGGTQAVQMAKGMGFKSSDIMDTLKSAPEKIQTFFAGLSDTNKILIGGFALVLVLIIVAIVLFTSGKTTSNFANVQDTADVQRSKAEDNASSLAAKVKGLSSLLQTEGFANPTSSKVSDLTLMNLQPFTVKQAGFLGPVDAGVFEEKTAIEQALRAGVRTFLFQVDYHEDAQKGPPSFPEMGEPCLLYRNDSGTLTSINAGSILRTSQAIAELGFSDKTVSKDDPIVIVLHGLRAPDAIEKPKDYIRYCSAIAKQLKPLAPYHLGLTSEGDYHRQALQGQLFNTPFTKYEKKIIILSTFDTEVFRSAKKLGMNTIDPVEDLDYWVNAQIYTDSITKSSGVAVVPGANSKARALLFSLDSLVNLSEAERKTWAARHKDTFTIALPSQNKNPSEEDFNLAITNLGVNIVPLDIFSFDANSTSRLTQLLERKTWKMRPLALRVSSK